MVAIAGLVFGQDAAQNSISSELGGLMGQQTAEVLQAAVTRKVMRSLRLFDHVMLQLARLGPDGLLMTRMGES